MTHLRELLITGCTDPMMWYADKVGQRVPLLGIWPESGYRSREPAGYSNVVRFADAEIVEVEP